MKTIILMATILLSNVYAQHSLSIQKTFTAKHASNSPSLSFIKAYAQLLEMAELEGFVCSEDIEVTSHPHLFNNKTTVKVSAICEKELE